MNPTELFHKSIEDSPEYQVSLDIISDNNVGNTWLIGGMVYRGIASELYGTSKPEVDLDFIVESSKEELNLPEGWSQSINHFGNPKLTNGETTIDFIPLDNIFSIIHRGLEPTIDNFLSGTPLDVQSIAYDVRTDEVIGEVGIQAIKNKEVRMHNQEQAELFAERYGMLSSTYLEDKAKSLGFTALL